MELHSIDAKKALAMEALIGGHHAEAEQLYEELQAKYTHYGHFDGQMTILYNRLLLALEQGHRRRILERMNDLYSALEANVDSPSAPDIARRICCLFGEPVPGVDFEATGALVALAVSITGDTLNDVTQEEPPEYFPTPSDYAGLAPLAASIKLLALGKATALLPGAPPWLKALGRLAGQGADLEDKFLIRLSKYVDAQREGDWLKAYRNLIDAQWAVQQNDLGVAFQLSVGLAKLEEIDFPKKMAFAPNPPPEKRYLQQAQLYRRLADALVPFDECGELVRMFSTAIIQATGRLFAYSDGNMPTYSSATTDGEVRNSASVLTSQAWRRLGRLDEAMNALGLTIFGPARGGLPRSMTDSRYLLESAQVCELGRDNASAYQLYADALRVMAPGFTTGRTVLELANLVHELGSNDQLLTGIIKALTGAARTGGQQTAIQFIDWARLVIDVAAGAFRGDLLAELQLEIELSGARYGDVGAPLRALEAARSIDDSASVVICMIQWAETLQDTPHGREQAVSLLEDAGREVRRMALGRLRRHLELALAESHCRIEEKRSTPTQEVMLRRVIEGIELDDLQRSSDFRTVFIQQSLEQLYESHVRRLVDEGKLTLARRMCTVWRNAGFSDLGKARVGRPRVTLEQWLWDEFESTWLSQTREGFVDWSMPDIGHGATQKGQVHTKRDRLAHRPDAIEMTLFQSCGFVFYKDEQSEEPSVFHVDVGLEEGTAVFKGAQPLEQQGLWERLLYGLPRRLSSSADGLLILGQVELLPFIVQQRRHGASSGRFIPCLKNISRQKGRAETRKNDIRMGLIGDAVSGRDLKLMTLEQTEGIAAISVCTGGDIADSGLKASLAGLNVVCLFGEAIGPSSMLIDEMSVPMGFDLLANALDETSTALLVIMGPLQGLQLTNAIRVFGPKLQGGLLIRTETGDSDRSILTKLIEVAAFSQSKVTLPQDLARACSDAQVGNCYSFIAALG
ncbi:MAG: hypothetical protein VYA30_10075 [Myxococcota bacterium]|nr:hypothetical protein [Myxococcota bacterium]